MAVKEALKGGVEVRITSPEDIARKAQRVGAAALPSVELLDGRQEPRKRIGRQPRPRPVAHQDAFKDLPLAFD